MGWGEISVSTRIEWIDRAQVVNLGPSLMKRTKGNNALMSVLSCYAKKEHGKSTIKIPIKREFRNIFCLTRQFEKSVLRFMTNYQGGGEISFIVLARFSRYRQSCSQISPPQRVFLKPQQGFHRRSSCQQSL